MRIEDDKKVLIFKDFCFINLPFHSRIVSYLKSKGVPEDSYSINEVNDESLCIVEENKKWHIFYSERGLRTEEYCYQDEHLAILYFINRLSKMLKFSFE